MTGKYVAFDLRDQKYCDLNAKWGEHDAAGWLGDQRWFKARPKRVCRVRLRKHMEAAGIAPTTHMMVLQMYPGLRLRMPISRPDAEAISTMRKRDQDAYGRRLIKKFKADVAKRRAGR